MLSHWLLTSQCLLWLILHFTSSSSISNPNEYLSKHTISIHGHIYSFSKCASSSVLQKEKPYSSSFSSGLFTVSISTSRSLNEFTSRRKSSSSSFKEQIIDSCWRGGSFSTSSTALVI